MEIRASKYSPHVSHWLWTFRWPRCLFENSMLMETVLFFACNPQWHDQPQPGFFAQVQSHRSFAVMILTTTVDTAVRIAAAAATDLALLHGPAAAFRTRASAIASLTLHMDDHCCPRCRSWPQPDTDLPVPHVTALELTGSCNCCFHFLNCGLILAEPVF